MKRKLAFGSRPKKTGARKKYRIKQHRKRLIAAGYDEAALKKMTPPQLRKLLRIAARKKAPKSKAPAKAAKAKKAK